MGKLLMPGTPADRVAPGWGIRVAGGLAALFLLAPIAVAGVVAFSSGSRLEFPIPGVSLRWFAVALSKPEYLDGLRISAIIGLAAAILAGIAGTGAALALHRYRFRGRAVAQALVMLPIAMPGIVLGLGLLFTLAIYRMQPGLLAAVLGHSVIGIPYVVAMVGAALANHDGSVERASLNLGVGPLGTLLRITLPLIKGGIVAGMVATFLVSFDNFSLSLFITRGNTLPLRLMQQLQAYADPSVAAISLVLVLLSLVALTVLLPLSARRA